LEFGGQLVDKKATFSRELSPAEQFEPAADWAIEDYPVTAPEESLRALSEAAGVFSRFRVDTRFGIEKWRRLYHAWVANSTLRTIADAVLIARTPEGRLAGFITFGREGEKGSIGLVAVAEDVRGLGLGRRLLKAAERRCVQDGVRQLAVTTQFDNAPACGLYRSANYRLSSLVHVYHFWL
jgi:dTDP-4-amino-4,6-dideoxy-D-galactose acyltransferase